MGTAPRVSGVGCSLNDVGVLNRFNKVHDQMFWRQGQSHVRVDCHYSIIPACLYCIHYIANSKFWPQILLQDADPAGLGTAQQAIALAPNGMLIASTTYTRLGPLLHQDVLTQ